MAKAPRIDRRFKDPENAPPIVSEKRLTFFMVADTYREIRLQSGQFQVANVIAGDDSADALPETPSAVVRDAIEYWLDQFLPAKERAKTDAEWKERIKRFFRELHRWRRWRRPPTVSGLA